MLPADTPRLRFRQMELSDLNAMSDLLGDPEVMRFYPAPKTRDQARAWIEWSRRGYDEHGHGLWIVETHDGAFVGDCGLTWQTVSGERALEIGFHVVTSQQGQGLATEAATACLDLARDRALAPRLVAIVHPDNHASARVAGKLGMHDLLTDEESGRHRRVLAMALTAPTPEPHPRRTP